MIKKKKDIVKYSKLFITKGFSPIRSGNISVRHKTDKLNGFFISPSGKKNDELKEDDIVFVAMNGEAERNKKPSSEWKFHLDLYKHTKCNSIVHSHSKFAVICSCLFTKIPSFHYMIALTGSKAIKVSKYSTFGTQKSIFGSKRRFCVCPKNDLWNHEERHFKPKKVPHKSN